MFYFIKKGPGNSIGPTRPLIDDADDDDKEEEEEEDENAKTKKEVLENHLKRLLLFFK